MARGGRRAGKPGKAYANRTDLAGKIPVQAAPNQAYGKAGAQMDAQRQLPMGAAPSPVGSGGGPASAGIPQLPPFDRPTERPDEPLTAGLSSGPGPGPEALNLQSPRDVELQAFMPYLPVLELQASQPNSSAALRILVRRIRGSKQDGA